MKNKGNSYYDSLADLAKRAVESAKVLREGREMQKTSAKAAKARDEILKNLGEEFLPPLEREDIAALAFSLAGLSEASALLSEYAQLCDARKTQEKLISNVYYYIKVIYDAVACLSEGGKSDNLSRCVEQMHSLSEVCSLSLLTARGELLRQQDTKKQLAGIIFCDACAGCYERLDSFCELLETVVIKN